MAELVGADIERLRTMASSFDDKAAAVRSLESRVSAACDELGRFWHGADAADFVSRWQSNHHPRLLAVASGLVDVSQLLAAHAGEQEVTSGTGGGGGRFGFGFGLPILDDGWDLVGEFASDTWDGLTDVAGAVAGETVHRVTEFGQHGAAYTERWLDNPIQSIFDELTLTGPFERLVAAGSILFLGGEYQENVRPGDAEFITGLPFQINDAITLGHSVLVDDARPAGGLIQHELQHVDDVEAVGGTAFYSSYLGNWLVNILGGQDPNIGGEAYENIWWEQRADAAQDGDPPFDLDFGRFDPRNWFD